MIPSTQNTTGSTAAQDFIFDADSSNFEDKVLKASMTTPVLVDFWAPWCGPCKQLMPVLEQAVAAAGGKVLLAKVNIDENQPLAQAFKVQSVPTVYALFQGQPVTAFNGARPASEIQDLVKQLSQMAGGPDGQPSIKDIIEAGEGALAEKNYQDAFLLFKQVLSHDPVNVEAYAGTLKALIGAGQTEDAQNMFDAIPDEIREDEKLQSVRKALELGQNAAGADEITALAQKADENPDDFQLRFDLAMAQFGAGLHEKAIDSLIEIIGRDREWEDEKARKQLLDFFEVIGPADPVTLKGRRKLSSILFS